MTRKRHPSIISIIFFAITAVIALFTQNLYVIVPLIISFGLLVLELKRVIDRR